MADDNPGSRGYRGSDDEHRSAQLEKKLTVRASDGSNFYFDRMEVHYQLTPSAAARVLQTSGPAEYFKHDLVATHAREILRDAFGRNSFLDIADPTTYGAATTEAKRRLNIRLEPYGVEVTQIVTPKPKFEDRVEKAIEDRQGAEQEIEVQAEKRRKLEQEQGLKVQAIEQEKNTEYQTLVAELEASKKAAENKLIAVRREADKYFIEREAAGSAYRSEKTTRAKANEVAYRKEAEGMVAKVSAVGAQGPDVLNSVIAEHVFPQLEKVRATPMVPMSTPMDLRYLGARPPASAAVSAPASTGSSGAAAAAAAGGN
jgi:regulator of protease activity HflC (stomatin/prohibitin superfamily)